MTVSQSPQEFIVPAATLEYILGLGNRRIRDLAADDHIVKAPGENSYALVASLKAIVAKKDAELATLREDVDPAMRQAKLSLTQSQLAISELKRGTMAGDLIPRISIQLAWARVAIAWRTAAMQIPARAKDRITKLTKADAAILKELCRAALTNAGAGDANQPPRIGAEDDDREECDGIDAEHRGTPKMVKRHNGSSKADMRPDDDRGARL